MRLWTIQPEEVYNIVISHGYYKCDGRKIDKWFRKSYRWLSKEMKEKLQHKPQNVSFPIWAWHTRNFKHKKPDLRSSEYGKRGERLVCMEIEIPDDEVLLTDFDAWHFVLNNWFLNTECWDEKTFDKDHAWLNSLPIEQKQKEIEKSWQGIYNISPVESTWNCRGKWIQATFWLLKKEQIISVQHFICK